MGVDDLKEAIESGIWVGNTLFQKPSKCTSGTLVHQKESPSAVTDELDVQNLEGNEQ